MVLSLDLPRSPECAREARSAIIAALAQDPHCDSLEVIASELVTNAYVHGQGDIHLELLRTATGYRMEVSNDTEAESIDLTPVSGSIDSERGRGLGLVQAFSSEMGATIKDARLTVWALIP
ncbi:MAG: ATP-binding protein [Candidatus Nanopelagicales bacterium]|nr:ATP-binding protein [Candidatus Nanopelagicales bacterium]